MPLESEQAAGPETHPHSDEVSTASASSEDRSQGSAEDAAAGRPASPRGTQLDLAADLDALLKQIEAVKTRPRYPKVRVRDHPDYREFAQMKVLGVVPGVLRELVENEGLDFEVLDDLDAKIELVPRARDDWSLSNSSMGTHDDDAPEMEVRLEVQDRRRGINMGALDAGGKASVLEKLQELHHGLVETPAVPDELKEFADDMSSVDDGSTSSSEDEDDGDHNGGDGPRAKSEGRSAGDAEAHDFLNGSLLFKLERLYAWLQLTGLLFQQQTLYLPPGATRYLRHAVLCNTWHTRAFRALLQQVKPVAERVTGVELFDLVAYQRLVDFATLLTLVLSVNFCLLYVWIIPDYTDPAEVNRWKQRYVTQWWTLGVRYTLSLTARAMTGVAAVAAPLAWWYGYRTDVQAETRPADGGRTMASQLHNPEFMGNRSPNYAPALAVVFVGWTFCVLCWVLFFAVVVVLRRVFLFKTKVNEAYTSVITIKAFVKMKVRLFAVFSTLLLVPTAWALCGVLLPHWDWNDSHATALREPFNFHVPCYFDEFPPVLDATTNRTLTTVHCYTAVGMSLYLGAAVAYCLVVGGTVLMFRSIIRETFRALEASDFYEIFLFSDRKYLDLRREVDRWSALKILLHQSRISSHFFGVWLAKESARTEDRAVWLWAALGFYARTVWKIAKRYPR